MLPMSQAGDAGNAGKNAGGNGGVIQGMWIPFQVESSPP